MHHSCSSSPPWSIARPTQIRKGLEEESHTPQPEKKEAEPVERSCPACDRTLRIPGDYSGTVRCPDCSEKFEVESDHMSELDEELDAIDDSVEEEQPVEKKIEIACTQCSSKLRVPSNYRVPFDALRVQTSSQQA